MSSGVLALDQGSHASRACIFDEAGALCASASVAVRTQQPAPLHVEHIADELVSTLRSAAEAAMRMARDRQPRLTLVAAGLAVQRSTIVCCSRVGAAALGPALSWQDRRNAEWTKQLAPHAARIREITGLPLSPHYGASKFRWCLDHLPAVARAAEAGELLAAPLASYLALQLGGTGDGVPLVDAANAARTLLFDSRRLDWSDELLRLFSIERAWLPTQAPTHGGWGTLSVAGHAVDLRAVTGDQSAVPYAGGDPDLSTVYVNLGTGAFIQQPLHSRPASPEPLLGSVLSRSHNGAIYSLEGTVNGAGSGVSWFCTKEHCNENELWPALEALPDGIDLPVFLNGVGGLGSPWWRVDLEPRYVGETGTDLARPPAGAGNLVLRFAALVESIAFMIAINAELLGRQAGQPRRVVMAGGMSRSGWLCRRLAALIERPVEIIDAEASARGVAQLAAPDFTARWAPPAMRRYLPAPDDKLRARYRKFAELLASAP